MLCQTQKEISYTATVMIVDALIHNLPTVMKNMKITIHMVYIYIISIVTFLFNNIYLAWHIANNIRNVSQINPLQWSFQVQSFFEEPHQTEMFQFLNKSEIFSAHDLHWDNIKQKFIPVMSNNKYLNIKRLIVRAWWEIQCQNYGLHTFVST